MDSSQESQEKISFCIFPPKLTVYRGQPVHAKENIFEINTNIAEILILFVYAKGIVKVTHRFRQIITVTFLTAAFGGVILFILRFIPGIGSFVTGLDTIMAISKSESERHRKKRIAFFGNPLYL